MNQICKSFLSAPNKSESMEALEEVVLGPVADGISIGPDHHNYVKEVEGLKKSSQVSHY